MKRRASHRRKSSGHPTKKRGTVADLRIIPLDDAPLRERAAQEFSRAMARLEKARAELRQFEQEDVPLFRHWMAVTFGALMTELRENERLIHEQEALIIEVETEMMFNGHSNPRKAYAAVMKRRQNPDENDDLDDMDDFRDEAESSEAKDPTNGTHDPGRSRTDDDFERDDFNPFEMGNEVPREQREEMFEEFVKSAFGIDPRRMSKADYANMFAEFEKQMFGDSSRTRPSHAHDRKKPQVRRAEGRIKEIYRALVRRLHPDLRADGDATVSAIWHEVQEAYEAGNLDRLETLLALTEMESGKNGGQASLSQMRGALAELNRAFQAIVRSINAAKRDLAWNFSRKTSRDPIEKRLRREMEEDLSHQRWVLADLKRTLDEWSRPLQPRKKKPLKTSKAPKKANTASSRREKNLPKSNQPEFFQF